MIIIITVSVNNRDLKTLVKPVSGRLELIHSVLKVSLPDAAIRVAMTRSNHLDCNVFSDVSGKIGEKLVSVFWRRPGAFIIGHTFYIYRSAWESN